MKSLSLAFGLRDALERRRRRAALAERATEGRDADRETSGDRAGDLDVLVVRPGAFLGERDRGDEHRDNERDETKSHLLHGEILQKPLSRERGERGNVGNPQWCPSSWCSMAIEM